MRVQRGGHHFHGRGAVWLNEVTLQGLLSDLPPGERPTRIPKDHHRSLEERHGRGVLRGARRRTPHGASATGTSGGSYPYPPDSSVGTLGHSRGRVAPTAAPGRSSRRRK